jgi:two-component system response regulator YesN
VTYKVFLVEDEITTREGIRDNVDWRAASFELCGEAPDGEIALPQIEAIQPDVLITDIRMPFMDGLQLCKIVREHMAWMKIIIISGYNDFQYAQTAIQLGVTEYLLKPVSVQDLQSVLNKVAYALDQEKSERAYLKRLRSQVEDNLALLRDKFLLRLVTGGESSLSAIEQSQQLGLNILAPFYQVALLQVRTVNSGQVLDYAACQQVEKIVSELLGTNMEVLLTKKDMEEFVLILKGENQEQIEEESAFLAGLVRDEVEKRTPYRLAVGIGSPQQRMSDLHCSFAEALVQLQDPRETQIVNELKKLDYAALRSYLEHGQIEEFEPFFDLSIRPLAEAALHSNLLKHYILVDISLTTAQFVSDLGGETAQILPDLGEKDADLSAIQRLEQMKARILRIFQAALTFRDSQEGYDRTAIIHRAQKYIANHYADSNLSLNEVAAQVNFSPNHFSAVFSDQTGETFRDYLTRTRIDQARKLLRATRLKCSEVAFQCGYNDPHYFSMMFRKNCGMTPQQFRASVRN